MAAHLLHQTALNPQDAAWQLRVYCVCKRVCGGGQTQKCVAAELYLIQRILADAVLITDIAFLGQPEQAAEALQVARVRQAYLVSWQDTDKIIHIQGGLARKVLVQADQTARSVAIKVVYVQIHMQPVSLLAIALQKIPDTANGGFQIFYPRQGNDAEVIRPGPVEGGALYHQDFFLQQQVQDKFFIVVDRAHLGVDTREGVQRTHRLDATDAGNGIEQFPGTVALFQQTPFGQHQIIDALIAAQCGLDGVLCRDVTAQAHIGQHIQAFDIAFGAAFGARDNQPARAKTCYAIGLGQAVKSQEQQIVGQRSDTGVPGIVVQNLVVDFVRQH